MKLIYKLLTSGLVASLLLVSCDKNNLPSGSTGDCKITSISGYYPSLVSIAYDSTGRIDTIFASPNLIRIFKYAGSNVKVETIVNARTENVADIELNTDKKIKKQTISYKDGSLELREYFYTNGNLTQERITTASGNYTLNHAWEAGNMVKTTPIAGISANKKIEYYPDLTFQKGDVNYIKQIMEENWAAVGTTSNLVKSNYNQDSIVYKADDAGKIVQAKIIRNGYATQTLNYQYTCK